MERVAIVTGGGTGLGADIAQMLAAEGVSVVVNGRRAEKLDDVVAKIHASNGQAIGAPGDISDPAVVRSVVEIATERFGPPNIIVNNAALHGNPVLTHEVPVEEFDRYLAVDLRAPFLLIREAVPHMLAAGCGSIVNIASIAGVVGLKYLSAYGAAKAGLAHLTRVVAMDYADRNIRANCICPGSIAKTETDSLDRDKKLRFVEGLLGPFVDVSGMDDPFAVAHPTGTRVAMGDISALVAYLVGDHARSITGQVISVDCGHTAR
jgi:NAD(P)-dependent dehydrogenase (short-subunit alcohol dehydrogenase family)